MAFLACVLRDGVAVGLWRLRRSGGRADVVIDPFERLDPATLAGIDEEIADVALAVADRRVETHMILDQLQQILHALLW